ncbi:hypothetical protein M409DRAFT_16949 [Zasmidium cellare ATCC 36951]|uniref:Cell wall proline rich protein n=1 Tax=Zasmidium cellare ATCC 36951 TaxID=1080233 RepID=A0A6A6D4E5_ZASCE|nr:uncharacterized protein M409DRAFT_16949 [Zasmidium cellare ATCC 36951]KAF2172999.1 hypothetical protein M409DRAFT_16949 [Zasmidium cellare ATCC 36951]
MSDASGLSEQQPEPTQTSPARSSHRRNNSEFVGGIGTTAVTNSSPTRGSGPMAIPERKPRHRGHTRSRVTLSSNELNAAITHSDVQPRVSTSLPSTPLEHPMYDTNNASDAHTFDDGATRPPSRPRVEFSDNVEYIPRPLSTISSETESSLSTVRGHSVNNSISSVLSLSSPSPQSSRPRAISLETTMEDEPTYRAKSSLEISKRLEREGQWLKGASSRENLKRPFSEPVNEPSKLTFAPNPPSEKPRQAHKKKQSISHALGFDRRRSEPAIGMHAVEPSRLSAVSLQETSPSAPGSAIERGFPVDRRSSSRKLKDWAVSKISRKARESGKPDAEQEVAREQQAPDESPLSEPAVAETDLDAVFNLDADEVTTSNDYSRRQFEFVTPSSIQYESEDSADHGTVLDLDAALGPFKTPPLGTRPRKELHSSRGTRDFIGPGLHYHPNPMHRRTESAPMLTPFEQMRSSTPPNDIMADVFEEDEEHEEDSTLAARPTSAYSTQDDEGSMGVKIVDSDIGATQSAPGLSLDDGLRIQHDEWELERPMTSYGNVSSRLSTPILDRRASSVIEDTIFEEASPVEPAIVEAHEEPRAHSLTKSSDSSETPTILATDNGMLALPDGQPSLTTPESYHSSAFSSPDLRGRQSSFETSRVGTSASSITDNRTMSSYTTCEQAQDMRISVDDVPSLTSSRSTMLSTMHANSSRRDVSGLRTPSVASGTLDSATLANERRRKRSSIQSLSQLMGNSFGPRPNGMDDSRPQTASDSLMAPNTAPKKKEHRLKKLMGALWKTKHRQASTSTVS